MASFTFTYEPTLSQSFQGQLASQYTNFVASYVQNTAADWIAFSWYEASAKTPDDLAKAQAISQGLQSGSFSLNDLFLAAQSKAGEIDPDGVPQPTVTVADVTIDIGSFFGTGTELETWTTGSGKSLQHHTREYFSSVDDTAPDGYDPDWDDLPPANQAPETTDDTATADEDTAVGGDLADNASDADGNDLIYVLTDDLGNPISEPAGLTFNADGTWTFDPSGDYDYLDDGDSDTFTFHYKVNDGTVDSNVSSVTVTVTGVNDAPTAVEIHATATETTSVYDDDHEITNQDLPDDSDPTTVDLLSTAFDPDDALSVSNFTFFDENGDVIDQPSYITIDGTNLVIEQNHPDLNDLKAGAHLLLSATYTISDGDVEIENTVNIDITGTADQYQGSGSGSDSVTFTGAQLNTSGSLSVELLDTLPDDASDLTYTSSISVNSSGIAGSNGLITIPDSGDVDWLADPEAGASIRVNSDHPDAFRLLVAGALDDGVVDFNVSKNGPNVDNTDTVTITLNYEYDYWYIA